MPGPKVEREKAYHHGDLHNALLIGAREVLAERGPAHLNLREIARRVGVTAPAAYHHFKNRDAIALGLAEMGAKELATRLKVVNDGAKAGLAQFGEAYVDFVRSNPALYRLMFGEGFPEISRNSKAVIALRQGAFEIMKVGLETRLPTEEIPAAAIFLWAIVHGLGLLLIDGQIEGTQEPKELIRRILRLTGKGLDRPGGRQAPVNRRPVP